MIEQAAQQQRRSAAEIFLAEWGTMGKHRPTLRTLLNLLVKAELFRAADYVAGDVLKGSTDLKSRSAPFIPYLLVICKSLLSAFFNRRTSGTAKVRAGGSRRYFGRSDTAIVGREYGGYQLQGVSDIWATFRVE